MALSLKLFAGETEGGILELRLDDFQNKDFLKILGINSFSTKGHLTKILLFCFCFTGLT
jgi:hypothetical protein